MDSQKKTKHKEKRRNNEKRKERSRDAARCRRSRETDIFTELAAALPISGEQAQHLDKASIMRLAIAYLKVRAVVDSVPESPTKNESMSKMDHLFAKALNGFMLVLSSDGNMVYLSENVSEYLGISQMDMMGQNVYEYSHPCDHDELRDCLTVKPTENNNEKRVCSFFLRLKCTLTSKGRKVNLKSASYKVIHCIGRLVKIRETVSNSHKQLDVEEEEEEEEEDEGCDSEERGGGGLDSYEQQHKEKKDQTSEDEANDCDTGFSLVMVACPIPHPSNIEIPLGRQTFLSKHSLSMKFTYADEKLAEYLGWSSEELMGQSVFEFHHALDNLALDKSFKSLFSKGQCETMAYRFLGKKGGYAWVVTQATLIHCSKQHKPLSVVCVNYIISGVEREDEIYSARQLAARNSVSLTLEKEQQEQQQQPPLIVTTSEELLLTVPDEITSIVEPSKERPSEFVLQPTATDDLLPTAKTLLETRAKPLSVTASLFRFANNNNNNTSNHTDLRKEEEELQKEYNVTNSPDNDIYKENKTPSPQRPTFIFQGKPAIQYDPSNIQNRPRPQAVTRNLFVPLVSATQQQQQQSSPGSQQQEPLIVRPPPQSATASIFAPRTEDMNKGFLTFSEDQPGLTMLKDEPEDLTHLAPTPGDVCVPLEDTPFFSDMLDEFILGNDNYCSLLSPSGVLTSELRSTELNSDPLKDTDFVGDSVKIKHRLEVSSLADCDPFMYGDSPDSPCSDGPTSTDSISLGTYRQSPEQSADSLGSPNGGGSVTEGLSEDEMLMLGISDSLADDELTLRAPYIPMSDQDEALELLISDDMVMWGPNESNNKESSKWLVDERDQRGGSDSSLAQLLKADSAVNRRYNDHGGGLVNPVQVLGQTCRKNPTSSTSTRSWPSTKSDRLDRPNKRNHTLSSATLSTSGIDKKRIKCEDSIVFNRLESNFDLENAYPAINKKNHTSSRKHSTNPTQQQQQQLAGSQLLRRLVSQENITRLMEKSSNNNFNRNAGNNHNTSNNHKKTLSSNGFHEDNNDEEQQHDNNEDDGGGGGKSHFIEKNYPKLQNIVTTTNSQQNQYPPSNSVLMNLLVSGCDDINTNNMINSCNVPMLLDKNYTSPLTVDLDNQTVPQYSPNPRDVATSNLHHLSPDTRKQLIGCLSGIGNATTIDSPTTFMCLDDDNDDDTTITIDLLRNLELPATPVPLSRNFV